MTWWRWFLVVPAALFGWFATWLGVEVLRIVADSEGYVNPLRITELREIAKFGFGAWGYMAAGTAVARQHKTRVAGVLFGLLLFCMGGVAAVGLLLLTVALTRPDYEVTSWTRLVADAIGIMLAVGVGFYMLRATWQEERQGLSSGN